MYVIASIHIIIMQGGYFLLFPFFLIGLILATLAGILLSLHGLQILWGGLLLWLAGTLAALLCYALLLLLVSFFLPTGTPPKRDHPFCRKVTTYTMGLLCRLARIQIHTDGLEKLPQGTPFLLVCNHRSNFDPLIAAWVLRRYPITFVMKPQILKFPIAGPFAFQSGYIPIDRDNNRAALKSILRAVAEIREDGLSIGIFPEGTRNHGSGLLPLRNGAFKIAQKAHVPIVVARLDGVENAAKNFPLRRTAVQFSILHVLPDAQIAAHSTTEVGQCVREILLGEAISGDRLTESS